MPTRTSTFAAPRRPLLVTSDAELLDDLLRLAAAGGSEVDLAPDPASARPRYTAAPLVVVGMDQAPACAHAGLPRRPRVVLATRSEYGGSAWELGKLLGVDHVAVLPAAEPWLVDRFAERISGRRPDGHGAVVAVVGGRGGAGASIFAAGLAVSGRRAGLRTLLVDADRLGGGLDVVLGWEEVDGLRWPALRQTDGRIDAEALVQSLPHRGGLVLASWDRGELLALPGEAMAAILDAGRRASDLIVVDVPRQFDDAAVLALQAADRAFVVVPAELRATLAARRVADAALQYCENLWLVVRGPSPGRLRVKDVVESLQLPLAGTLRPEPALCKGMEHGEAPGASGRGPLAALCQRLVAEVVGAAREATA